MPTSRQRILDFIDKNNTVTVNEISRSMGVTGANIRHHLNILLENGLVKIAGKRPAQGKGRPSRLFSLSSTFKGNNLEMLLSAVLSEINQDLSTEFDDFITRIARRVAVQQQRNSNHKFRTYSSGQLTMRLVSTIEHLSRLNYRPHWEAHIEGPQIILGNCPYISILNEHPELCVFDRQLIEELILNPVEFKVKLKKDERNIPYCLFRVIEN